MCDALENNMNSFKDSKGKFSKFTSLGGYPIYYIYEDCNVCCPDCANVSNDATPVAADINWEDITLYCDSCNQCIESAYGEDTEQQGLSL